MTTPAGNPTNNNTSPGTSIPRPAPGPSTPAAFNSNLTSISTPKSQHTPGGHGSPAHRGTPRSRAGMFGGKMVAGGSGLGGKTMAGNGEGTPALGSMALGAHGTPFALPNSSFNFGSPAFTFTSPNASGAGSTSIDALTGFTNPAASYSGMEGGTSMGMSLSSFGINLMGPSMSSTGSAAGKTDDAERKRRLEVIIDTIGRRPGRISREGLERLGRKCGLDTQMGEVDDLAMAGKNILVDFEFDSNHSQNVKRVAVTLATAADALTEHAEKAAEILQRDLTPPTRGATVNATLEKFADNLERLARLDRLSVPGASCFDAIFGVYASLKKLYDYEKQAADELFGTGKSQRAAREVMCKKNGMPRMHVGNRVGLALEYWADRRLLDVPIDDMQIDHDKTKSHSKDKSGEHEAEHNPGRLVIECEPLPSHMYPPIAITTDWLSDRVEKDMEEIDITLNGGAGVTADPRRVIDWLDPPPPVLPTLDSNPLSTDGTETTSITGQPQARFVAKFEPPVMLPLHIAAQIFSSVGVDISQDAVSHTTIPSLALPHGFISGTGVEQQPRSLNMHRSIVGPKGEHHDYDLTLYTTRPELARVVDSMPFAHPKQLIAILPVLRQYLFTTRLLQKTFSSLSTTSTQQMSSLQANGSSSKSMSHALQPKASELTGLEAELFAILDGSTSESKAARSLDVALSTTPIPQFTLVFSGPCGPKRVTLNILLNAEVEVVEQDIITMIPEKDVRMEGQDEVSKVDEEGKKVRAALAKALTVCEDLVVWAEWVRQRFLENK